MPNPTVETTTGSAALLNVSTNTIGTHTVTSANKLVAVVGIGNGGGGQTISNIRWNGIDLTQDIQKSDANFEECEIWSLANPSAGNFNAVLNLAGLTEQVGWCVIGVLDVSTAAAPSSSTASTNNPSVVAANSANGYLCIAGLMSDAGSASATTPGGTQLFELENINSDSDFNVQSVSASGANQLCTWTETASGGWAAVVLPLQGTGAVADAIRLRFPMWCDGVGGGMVGGNRVHDRLRKVY